MINNSYCYYNSNFEQNYIINNQHEHNFIIIQVFITLYISVYLIVLSLCDIDLLNFN